MAEISKKLSELIESGRIVAVAKLFEASPDTITYTSKATGQPGMIRQIKLSVKMAIGKSNRIIAATLRVPEGEEPEKLLATMDLKEGSKVILDIDSLVKVAATLKGAESSVMLRLHAVYPFIPEDPKPDDGQGLLF